MWSYRVRLGSVPGGHDVPALLFEFSRWLSRQPYPAVGRFEIRAASLPREAAALYSPRLNREAWLFADLADRSSLVLIDALRPMPILRLTHGHALKLVAASLESFLVLLANQETGVTVLDADDTGRSELRTWLKLRHVRLRASDFNLRAYLHDAVEPRQRRRYVVGRRRARS